MINSFCLFLSVVICFTALSLSAQDAKPKSKKGLWGFRIDGTKVLDYQYDTAEKISYQFFEVTKAGKSGIVNNIGIEIIPCICDEVLFRPAQNGISCKKDNKKGFYNSDGKLIIPFRFEDFELIGDVLLTFEDGLWAAQKANGKVILQREYDLIKYTTQRLFKVKKKDLWGVLDSTAQILLPIHFEAIDHYKEEGSLVKKDGAWGFYSKDGFKLSSERIIFHDPEQPAQFVDCPDEKSKELKAKCAEREMLMFVYRNIKYPAEAHENGIQGMSIINYLISPEGKVSETKVLKGIGSGCDEEALRIINSMPTWIPAHQDGKPVWTMFTMPVKYKLQ